MALRILHIADIHLGVESCGRIDPQTGLSTRLADFTKCLDVAIDRATKDGIDLFLVAGDAYRSRDPNPTLQRELALRVRRLAAAGVAVFLLVGNHDLPNAFGRATALEIFSALQVPNVTVARRPDTYRIQTRRGDLQVVAVPWVPRSSLLAADELRGRPEEEVNEAIAEKLGHFLEQEVQSLNPDIPAVLTAHIGVIGAEGGSERMRVLGRDLAVPRSMLTYPSFDYVALGHIHRQQVLQAHDPPVIYSGSIERVDFGEEKEAKGFVIAEVGGETCRYELVEVPARRFVTIEVDGTGPDPLPRVLQAIERKEVADCAVRLRVVTTRENQARLPIMELRRALKDAHYSAISVEAKSERRSRFSEGFPEAMSPQQALARYLQARQVSPERTQRLLDYSQRLQAGAQPDS